MKFHGLVRKEGLYWGLPGIWNLTDIESYKSEKIQSAVLQSTYMEESFRASKKQYKRLIIKNPESLLFRAVHFFEAFISMSVAVAGAFCFILVLGIATLLLSERSVQTTEAMSS